SIIHPSGICGPNDYSYGPVAQMVQQYINGEIKMGLEGTFNSVDVRDLAEAVISCCDKGKRGECYIIGNELVTMKQLFEIINEAAGLDIHANIIPKGIAKAAVKILKLQSKFTGKEPLLNEFALYNLIRNNDYDCTKAKKDLGFTCRPFEETIEDEVRWLQEEAKNKSNKNTTQQKEKAVS
ncbi:MAG: nucleoside-diphosphate sugar epimerase, partial [Butyrivibrio sp.]|nr:nucleoside-diphosphate sugar epimerase [Butyrivibrio sp.]